LVGISRRISLAAAVFVATDWGVPPTVYGTAPTVVAKSVKAVETGSITADCSASVERLPVVMDVLLATDTCGCCC
jgi:hypothetical protein